MYFQSKLIEVFVMNEYQLQLQLQAQLQLQLQSKWFTHQVVMELELVIVANNVGDSNSMDKDEQHQSKDEKQNSQNSTMPKKYHSSSVSEQHLNFHLRQYLGIYFFCMCISISYCISKKVFSWFLKLANENMNILSIVIIEGIMIEVITEDESSDTLKRWTYFRR
ncbi:hypothetical protein ACTFIY_009587 [Dictyostelium cf. discoideum]